MKEEKKVSDLVWLRLESSPLFNKYPADYLTSFKAFIVNVLEPYDILDDATLSNYIDIFIKHFVENPTIGANKYRWHNDSSKHFDRIVDSIREELETVKLEKIRTTNTPLKRVLGALIFLKDDLVAHAKDRNKFFEQHPEKSEKWLAFEKMYKPNSDFKGVLSKFLFVQTTRYLVNEISYPNGLFKDFRYVSTVGETKELIRFLLDPRNKEVLDFLDQNLSLLCNYRQIPLVILRKANEKIDLFCDQQEKKEKKYIKEIMTKLKAYGEELKNSNLESRVQGKAIIALSSLIEKTVSNHYSSSKEVRENEESFYKTTLIKTIAKEILKNPNLKLSHIIIGLQISNGGLETYFSSWFEILLQNFPYSLLLSELESVQVSSRSYVTPAKFKNSLTCYYQNNYQQVQEWQNQLLIKKLEKSFPAYENHLKTELVLEFANLPEDFQNIFRREDRFSINTLASRWRYGIPLAYELKDYSQEDFISGFPKFFRTLEKYNAMFELKQTLSSGLLSGNKGITQIDINYLEARIWKKFTDLKTLPNFNSDNFINIDMLIGRIRSGIPLTYGLETEDADFTQDKSIKEKYPDFISKLQFFDFTCDLKTTKSLLNGEGLYTSIIQEFKKLPQDFQEFYSVNGNNKKIVINNLANMRMTNKLDEICPELDKDLQNYDALISAEKKSFMPRTNEFSPILTKQTSTKIVDAFAKKCDEHEELLNSDRDAPSFAFYKRILLTLSVFGAVYQCFKKRTLKFWETNGEQFTRTLRNSLADYRGPAPSGALTSSNPAPEPELPEPSALSM